MSMVMMVAITNEEILFRPGKQVQHASLTRYADVKGPPELNTNFIISVAGRSFVVHNFAAHTRWSQP